MSSIRIFSGFGSSGQNRRPEKVPMKPSSLSTPKVKHASWLGTIPWRSPGRSSIGASTGAGGVETGPASSSRSQAGRTTERSAVVLALETKFLLFAAGQEQDSVLSWSPALPSPHPASLASPCPPAAPPPTSPGLVSAWRSWSPPRPPSFQQAPPSKHASPSAPARSPPAKHQAPAAFAFASSRSAAAAPGPPKHHVTPEVCGDLAVTPVVHDPAL